MLETVRKIEEWADERELFTKSDPDKQMEQLAEEFHELDEHISANGVENKEEAMLELGDCFVVLTILAKQLGFQIEDSAEAAYNKISKRKGKLINGIFVKEEDLADFEDLEDGTEQANN